MSQKKVDAYKEYKKNKDKIIKKEKMMFRIEVAIVALVCALFIGWFGWSIYNSVTTASEEAKATEAVVAQDLDITAYQDYIGGLQSTFTS